MAKTRTNEGAVCYDHSLDNATEFFSKAGSLYKTKTKKSFYKNETSALELFKPVWCSGQKEIAMKLLFWLRDPRGGAGNRSGFRDCLKWLVETDPKWIDANKHLIPLYGRYDDLRMLFATSLEDSIAEMWSNKIVAKDGLACKWADRKDTPILKKLRSKGILKDIGEFRRMLAKFRNFVPEAKMCSKNWKEIEYPKVPSVAMSRYTKAFAKNDAKRFEKYKEALVSGEAKINASALFPHDLVRTVLNGDAKIADAQFEALPNYMGKSNARIMTIVDTSGSMSSIIGGSVHAWHVSTSLGLYCSDRLGKDNPFYKNFLQFASESKLTDWGKYTFSEAYKGYSTWGGKQNSLFDGACSGTRIDKALDSILNFAVMFKATNEQIPNMLLIISDMQFQEGSSVYGSTDTEVERCMKKWDEAGYARPKIVYWNTDGYAGSQDVATSKNVGLVSGFSPSILEAILNAKDFTPKGIMLEKIKKYEIVVPN